MKRPRPNWGPKTCPRLFERGRTLLVQSFRNGGDRKGRTDEEYVRYFKESFKDGDFKVANPVYSNLNENTIKRLHEEGFRVGAWVINDEPTLNQFLDWGINSITTDNPALLVKVIKDRRQRKNGGK